MRTMQQRSKSSTVAAAPVQRRDKDEQNGRAQLRAFADRIAATPGALQLKSLAGRIAQAKSQTPSPRNETGLPGQLKSGVEALSGLSLDNVRVHYNSSQPAQLNAHAFTRGSDIHVAPGQERHLPHEAWHVVQQAQGRVAATTQMKAGVPLNDDSGLEREADVMGDHAMRVAQRLKDGTSEEEMTG